MAKRNSIQESLAKLAAAEGAFLQTLFLAPVAPVSGDRQVQVRIAGIRCSLRIKPADYSGWGIFRPENHREATLVRDATFGERQRYLELFPSIPLITCLRDGTDFHALPANRGDTRITAEGFLPVRLAESAQQFETIRARFDGTQFWFDTTDARSDPSTAAYLRESLVAKREPDQVSRPGLTAEQSSAYAIVFAMERQREIEQARHTAEGRLSEALTHAGAALRQFADLGDAYRVTFDVDGHRHTSVVRRGDLTVQSAGICLSGEDAKFDLHSLVSVLREGHSSNEIRHMGT